MGEVEFHIVFVVCVWEWRGVRAGGVQGRYGMRGEHWLAWRQIRGVRWEWVGAGGRGGALGGDFLLMF